MVEQRAARIEADEVCAVTAQRLGEVTDRLWWIVSEQLRQHDQGAHLLEAVAPLSEVGIEQRSTLEAIRGEVPSELQVLDRDLGSEGAIVKQLAAVHGTTEEGAETTEGLEAAIDAGAESTRGALWYLIGAAMGAFVGYFFYRQVMPRA